MESSKIFLASETLQLVKLYCDADWQKKFDNHKKSQKHVWHELATELEITNGINRTGEQCQNKIKNLKKEFFKIKRAPSGSGRTDWPYYEDFAKVFGGSALLNPVIILDSLDQSENDLLTLDDDPSAFDTVDDPTALPLPSEKKRDVFPSTSKEALEKAKTDAYITYKLQLTLLDLVLTACKKRKNPGQQIYEYLRKSEVDDKRQIEDSKKADADFLSEIKKMNSNMEELIALKKQKLEQAPMFHLPYFQPPSPVPPRTETEGRKKLSGKKF